MRTCQHNVSTLRRQRQLIFDDDLDVAKTGIDQVLG